MCPKWTKCPKGTGTNGHFVQLGHILNKNGEFWTKCPKRNVPFGQRRKNMLKVLKNLSKGY